GNTWSFFTEVRPPAKVTDPSPANGAQDQEENIVLRWEPSALATSYLLTFNDIFIIETTNTEYELPKLSLNSNYSWRVDVKRVVNLGMGTSNPSQVITGDTWSFKTKAAPKRVRDKLLIIAGGGESYRNSLRHTTRYLTQMIAFVG